MVSTKQEIEKGLSLLAKSSLIVFVGVLLSKVFMYFYRVIIARHYGPEVYGLFSIAFMIMGFLIAFFSLGFPEGLTRFIPIYRSRKEKDKIKYLIKLSKKVLFISGILSAILLYLAADFIALTFFHNSELSFYLKIFAFLIPIQILRDVYFGIIRSHERISANSFGVHVLQNMVKLIFIIFFIYLGINSYYAISFSYFLGVFFGLLFAFFYCKIRLPYIFLNFKLLQKNKITLRKKIVAYSWPLVLFTIIGTLMVWMDTFLIGYFENSYWAGIYNAAIPIASLLAIPSEIFMQMFFPLITRELGSKNFITAEQLSKQITKWIFILNLPLTILILLFPGIFINFFFGPDYLFAVNALKMLALGQIILSMGAVSSSLLLSLGKSKMVLTNLIFVSIINFILNFNLIPLYGINGAAFSTLLSLIILSFLTIIENYYFSKIFPFRRKMITIFFITLIPSTFLYIVSNIIKVNLMLLIFLGFLFVLIYFILILLTKSFDSNDLIILKSFKNKIHRK